jgi:predicted DsbA family dithiol-disulfide isomerase
VIIDVWSDVVCPWCFIGKRRLEKALKEMQANVCAVADGEGLCYNLDDTLSGNTFDAHRLLLWAASIDKDKELLEAMYSGYFEKSLPLFSHQDLISIAESVGIAAVDVVNVLDSEQFAAEVIRDRDVASSLGATGVPFFVIDMKYGISGAQPVEVFTQTLETAWADR